MKEFSTKKIEKKTPIKGRFPPYDAFAHNFQ